MPCSLVIFSLFAGMGRLITICNTDSPPAYPVMVHMNFTNETIAPLSSLNWATADQSHIPGKPLHSAPDDLAENPSFQWHRQLSSLLNKSSPTDNSRV